MNDAAYSATESRLAKRLKKLWREERGDGPSHMACLRLVRIYASEFPGVHGEERAARIMAAVEEGR